MSADITGSVRAPAGAVAGPALGHATVIAALPPQDQPEQSPPRALPPQFHRQLVEYVTSEPAGTVIIDTPHTYLYLVRGNGNALRYGIGVGREGFTWSGSQRISRMSEWPDWHPPKEMIERQPYLPRSWPAARATRSARAHSTSATRSTAFMAPTSHQRSAASCLRMHPADQRGYRGSLRPSEHRHPRRGLVGIAAGLGFNARPDRAVTSETNQDLGCTAPEP